MVNHQFAALCYYHVTCHMIGTKADPRTDRYYREVHFRERNRFLISRSRNWLVLSVLECRPNGTTEPTGNPERVGPNRPKHAIYRFGSNRISVLDRPNASSGKMSQKILYNDMNVRAIQPVIQMIGGPF